MKIKAIEGGVCAAKGFRAAGVPAADDESYDHKKWGSLPATSDLNYVTCGP